MAGCFRRRHGGSGRGADQHGCAGGGEFVFAKGDGRDRITDFQDNGTATDDRIASATGMFNTMTEIETLTGVELQFNAKTRLTVEG